MGISTTLGGMTFPPQQNPQWQPQPPQRPQQPPQWQPSHQMPAGYPQQPPQWQPTPLGQHPQQFQPPVPPKKGLSTGKLLLIIGAGLVGLCCVGGMVAAVINPSSNSSTSATSDSAPAPAVTTANPVITWYADGGQDHMNALAADLTKIGTAGQSVDAQAMRAACVSLQKDVEAAQAYRPFPDSEGQKWLAAMLAASARAATDCVAAVDTNSGDLMTRAGTEIREADDALNKFAARKQQLGA